jgi:metal-responsive CopG/Arc/MetJ family transcriptional regulator
MSMLKRFTMWIGDEELVMLGKLMVYMRRSRSDVIRTLIRDFYYKHQHSEAMDKK